jgi:hypothetical protein
LKFLLDQKLATIPQHQWASKLLGSDFQVEFKSSASNVVADALSRHDAKEDAAPMALSASSASLFNDIRRELDTDEALQQLKAEVETGTRDKH